MKYKSIIRINLDLTESVLQVICQKKIKDGAYVINLNEYANIGAHWIALYILNNDTINFDRFRVERVPKEIRHFIENKNIKANMHRIQANNFTTEIKERKAMSKRLNRYIAAFDYIDKILIVLSAGSGGVSIISFSIIIGIPVGIMKKLLKTTKNEKKKHNEIVVLAKSKLNSTKTFISQTLIDSEISHKEFILNH